jgi:hypothetical protein
MNITKQMTVPEQILYGGFYIIFVGDTGCGKTTSLTWFAYWVNEGLQRDKITDIKLYSNYELINNDELIWNYELLEHPDQLLKLKRGFIFIDEIWRWFMDSYNSMQNARKGYDDICANARKRGIGLFVSSQRIMRIDPNFRTNIHYIVEPSLFYDEFNRPYRILMVIGNNQKQEFETSIEIDPNPVFSIFNTREEIERFDPVSNIDMENLAKEFIEWNTITTDGHSIIKQHPTQSVVNLFLKQKILESTGNSVYDEFTRDERGIFKALVMRL